MKKFILFSFLFLLLLMLAGCSKSIEGWETYDDGYLSFQYPSGLKVSNSEFEDFTYFDGININIVRYDYDSYLNRIKQDEGIWAIDLSNQELEDYENQNLLKYREIINLAKNGNRDGSDICTYDCSRTAGIIGSKKMDIGNVHGVLNNYYFTQDPLMACLSQINTELILFTKDYVYSIMFRYNFGDTYTFLYPYKGDHDGEICLYDSFSNYAENISNTVEQFFRYETDSLKGDFLEPFEKNYNIILKMIGTISL